MTYLYCVIKYPEEKVVRIPAPDEHADGYFARKYRTVLYANSVWGERANGERFCYKNRDVADYKNATISDEDFFLLKLQAVTE